MARQKKHTREKQGLYVTVRNNDVARAARKLKRLMQDEGMILEMRKRKYYVKPSEKRAKAKAAGRARWLKKQSQLALQ
tara:strand:- start:817 stop:1050 length:234 start_codon:yes stop_codon:yes gene_type:complete